MFSGGIFILYTYQVSYQHEDTLKDELIKYYQYSMRLIREIKNYGKIILNTNLVGINQKIQTGDLIEIEMPKEKRDFLPSAGKIDIVYQDSEILILNKEPYCITHPTRKNQHDTLANYVSQYYQNNDIQTKIRFINRLDRDTTGLIAIAKNKYVHHFVQKQMEAQTIKKTYIAYVYGILQKKSGCIDQPIGLKKGESITRSVLESGPEALTNYQVLKEFKDASLIKIELKTGRTHQIRVHLNYIGHPILGDFLYYTEKSQAFSQKLKIDHQALHASELKLYLPLKGKLFVKAKVQNNMLVLESKLLKLSGKRGKE